MTPPRTKVQGPRVKDPPQKKLPSKNPALLWLKFFTEIFIKFDDFLTIKPSIFSFLRWLPALKIYQDN